MMGKLVSIALKPVLGQCGREVWAGAQRRIGQLHYLETMNARYGGRLAVVLAGGLWLSAAAWAVAGSASAADFFSPPQVLSWKVQIGDSALAALAQEPKVYVKATLEDGRRTLADIGIRYKGRQLLGKPGPKPSFTLKFNEFVPGQRLGGVSKVILDASHDDPTYLTALLANELHRAAGVPAPRTAFVHLTINGKDLGLYVLVEGMNKDFLAQYFERTKGNLYEGDGCDITGKLDKDSGDSFKDQPDVDALAQAALEANPAARWAKLQKVLDVDRFVSFMAVEVLAWQTNGYSMGTNKYRLYHDLSTDRMLFMPHGCEPGFGAADGPLVPTVAGVVARAVLQCPEGKKLYQERMAKLLATVFKPQELQTRVDTLASQIRPVLAKSHPAAVPQFEAAVAQLREQFGRRAYVLEQALRSP